MSENIRIGEGDRPNEGTIIDLGQLDTPHTIERRRDNVRERIAMLLTYTVVAISLLPLLMTALFPDRADAIQRVAAAVITATVGIYGTIIGFYFGERK